MGYVDVGVSASSSAQNLTNNSSGGSFDDVEITGAGSSGSPKTLWLAIAAAVVIVAFLFLKRKKS